MAPRLPLIRHYSAASRAGARRAALAAVTAAGLGLALTASPASRARSTSLAPCQSCPQAESNAASGNGQRSW
ncbi:MAG: hypothetical protein R6W06_02655 [Prochlorococcaceae cyanobacterium]